MSPAVPRVVVLGDVMLDVVAVLDAPFAPGSDAPARVATHGGGSAANVAAWLARAGEPVALVGRVGDDAAGRQAAAELRALGVEAHLALDRERATGTCVVLVEPGGERSMLPDAGANAGLQAGDLPEALLAPGRHLHVAGYALLRPGSREAARGAIARALAHRMTVSVDPSSAAPLAAAGAAAFLRLGDAARACCSPTPTRRACWPARTTPSGRRGAGRDDRRRGGRDARPRGRAVDRRPAAGALRGRAGRRSARHHRRRRCVHRRAARRATRRRAAAGGARGGGPPGRRGREPPGRQAYPPGVTRPAW